MKLVKKVKSLCTPAFIYLVVSALALTVLIGQNAGNTTKYCAGSYTCDVSSTGLVLLVHALYIIFWTFVLDLMCKAGYKKLSWLVLLFPFVLGFVLIGMFMLEQSTIEGHANNNKYKCSDCTKEKNEDDVDSDNGSSNDSDSDSD